MHKNIKRKLKRIADALKKAFLEKKYITEFQYKPQEPMEYICVPVNIKRKEDK
jgi:hypothetical protein